MTLTDGNETIGAAARAALHSAFGGISGVQVLGIYVLEDDVWTKRLSVSINGWSPSLHLVEIGYVADVALNKDGTVIRDDAVKAFAEAVGEQTRRAARGLALGRALPLPAGENPVTGAAGPHVDHLLVDRALPVLADLDNDDFETSLINGVMDLHTQIQVPSNGGPHLADEITSVTEEGDRMTVRRLVPIDTLPGIPCTFDGEILLVGGGREVPETVMPALPGRPLRTLITIHPQLDDRLILEVGTGDAGDMALRLEPDLVPVCEALRGQAGGQGERTERAEK